MTKTSTSIILAVAFITLFVPVSQTLAFVPILDKDLKSDIKLKLPVITIKNTEEFCANFTETAEKISGNLSERQTKIDDFIAKREEISTEKREARDNTLNEQRSAADMRRTEWHERLESRANIDDEKDAVLKFKQTLESAVDKRQDAVDTAIKDFRDGVDDILIARKNTLKNASVTFKTATDAAVAQVNTDCDNGKSTIDIKKTFRANLKTARETLKTERQNAEKVGIKIKSLAETRRTSVQKAISDFKITATTATKELKQAFQTN